MIDKQTLKKHNLKAVPFSCIGEGQTFNTANSIEQFPSAPHGLTRRREGDWLPYADGQRSSLRASHIRDWTVYVPIWRVTEVVL